MPNLTAHHARAAQGPEPVGECLQPVRQHVWLSGRGRTPAEHHLSGWPDLPRRSRVCVAEVTHQDGVSRVERPPHPTARPACGSVRFARGGVRAHGAHPETQGKPHAPLATGLLYPSGCVHLPTEPVRPRPGAGAVRRRPSGSAQVVPLRPDLGRATLEDLMKIQITSASRKEQRADDIAGGGVRAHAGRHPPIGHAHAARAVPAGAGRAGRAADVEQLGGVDPRLQRPVLEQAPRAHRRPVDLPAGVLRRVLGRGQIWCSTTSTASRSSAGRAAPCGAPTPSTASSTSSRNRRRTRRARWFVWAPARSIGTGVTARYGGSFGSAAYRVYSQWTGRRDTTLANWRRPTTRWSVLTNGLRVDWSRGNDELMVDGSVRAGDGHDRLEPLRQPAAGSRAADRRRVVVPDRQRAGPMDASRRQRVVAAGAIVDRDPAPRPISCRSDENSFDADAAVSPEAGRAPRHRRRRRLSLRRQMTTGRNFSVSFDPPTSRYHRRQRVRPGRDRAGRARAPHARSEARARYVFRMGPAADRSRHVGPGAASPCLGRGVARAADAVD